MARIGKLTEIEARELWKYEQQDFSSWLAKEENISYLNDILNLTLTDVQTEVPVGPFSCDIVATDEMSGIKVIIENQLEPTNHDHLGKIITYAAGLEAQVLVWIAKKAKEEHRAAVEWLNNNTNKNINIFLIEIHAYKIGDSLPAPKFEVLVQPNDYIKFGQKNSESKGLERRESERLVFWVPRQNLWVDFSGNLLFELSGSAPPIPTHEGRNQWSFDTSPESLGFPMSNRYSLSWTVSQR